MTAHCSLILCLLRLAANCFHVLKHHLIRVAQKNVDRCPNYACNHLETVRNEVLFHLGGSGEKPFQDPCMGTAVVPDQDPCSTQVRLSRSDLVLSLATANCAISFMTKRSCFFLQL